MKDFFKGLKIFHSFAMTALQGLMASLALFGVIVASNAMTSVYPFALDVGIAIGLTTLIFGVPLSAAKTAKAKAIAILKSAE